MKIIQNWKRLTHNDGFFNDGSGQKVVILKKEYSNNYIVRLLECGETNKREGKIISPDYSSKAKAEIFAINWMEKHPKGTV